MRGYANDIHGLIIIFIGSEFVQTPFFHVRITLLKISTRKYCIPYLPVSHISLSLHNALMHMLWPIGNYLLSFEKVKPTNGRWLPVNSCKKPVKYNIIINMTPASQ